MKNQGKMPVLKKTKYKGLKKQGKMAVVLKNQGKTAEKFKYRLYLKRRFPMGGWANGMALY